MMDKRFKKAAAVLAAFEDLYGNCCDAVVGHFSNCREQGYVLCLRSWVDGVVEIEAQARPSLTHGVCFAEHRSSDSIVIYRIRGFRDTPNEDEWKDALYCAPTAYTEAAVACWDWLTAAENRMVEGVQ